MKDWRVLPISRQAAVQDLKAVGLQPTTTEDALIVTYDGAKARGWVGG